MSKLSEFENIRQQKGSYRRFFSNKYFQLYIWYNEKGGKITGFQLVYTFNNESKALTWTEEENYSHLEVEGWDNSAYQGTPLLIADGQFPYEMVMNQLKIDVSEIEQEIREFVINKIEEMEQK